MERVIKVNPVLDYALFRAIPASNRYEVVVYVKGKSERLSTVMLDELALNLTEAERVHSDATAESFRLQVVGSPTWFTKSTLARFLYLVNSPEVFKKAKEIENEISQLDEARRFHLSLYAKDFADYCGDGLTDVSPQGVELTNSHKLGSSSSDNTKRELLQAMELRLAALKEELVTCFNEACGATCSTHDISNIISFSKHFGAEDLRMFLTNYLVWCAKDPTVVPAHDNSSNKCRISDLVSQETIHKNVPHNPSPANIAFAERQSSTESEGSSVSSDGEQISCERSRPMIRSASPRRSASPMKRIQIGRSGSRRSTALSIKSLSYFSSREKISANQDADATNSGDDEIQAVAEKKPENSVRRMSVQDAIDLFESKQKDQNLDVRKKKASGQEASKGIGKAVLRRWSAGMGDSFNRTFQVVEDCIGVQNTAATIPVSDVSAKELEEQAKVETEFLPLNSSQVDGIGTQLDDPSKVAKIPPSTNNGADEGVKKAMEVVNQAVTASEWSRQKEVELNEMLMKMMENKPTKYQARNASRVSHLESSNELRGNFSAHYAEKTDEKLLSETSKKKEAKTAQFKILRDALEQSKSEMESKGGLKGKPDSPAQSNQTQRQKRNSTPPVISKNVSKPTSSTKASPKSSSPSPTVRTTSSTGQLPKMSGVPTSRNPPRTISVSTDSTRKKPQSTPSPTRINPRAERQAHPTTTKKGVSTLERLESNNSLRKRTGLSTSQEDHGATTAKPSFYNKVAKKSSVVPLETKPFLKKGSGVSQGLAKTKVFQSDDSSKNNDALMRVEEVESPPCVADETSKPEDFRDNSIEVHDNVVADVEGTPHPCDLNQTLDHESPLNSDLLKKYVEIPVAEIESDGDMGIKSPAWVEVLEHQELLPAHVKLPEDLITPDIVSRTSSSPKIHHSLSQMLQDESGEPEIIEWGNAENPPALVYHKDAPKGLKRLLKFARKSKGETNVAEWEFDDDQDEQKASGKKNTDALLQKVSFLAKGSGQQRAILEESYDSRSSSKRSTDSRRMHDPFSAQSSIASSGPENPREGLSNASASSSTKTTRSFFSFSRHLGASNQARQSLDGSNHSSSWWR